MAAYQIKGDERRNYGKEDLSGNLAGSSSKPHTAWMGSGQIHMERLKNEDAIDITKTTAQKAA